MRYYLGDKTCKIGDFFDDLGDMFSGDAFCIHGYTLLTIETNLNNLREITFYIWEILFNIWEIVFIFSEIKFKNRELEIQQPL